ncbi:MAG: hypothetical protein KC635_28105 [Myxococcales bacterium]|nr:hypothetical protein [Myxococcales bacterium]
MQRLEDPADAGRERIVELVHGRIRLAEAQEEPVARPDPRRADDAAAEVVVERVRHRLLETLRERRAVDEVHERREADLDDVLDRTIRVVAVAPEREGIVIHRRASSGRPLADHAQRP